jgi:cellulose synthase/poly-beta-1,6-N-acetylglucosamine synthase-like glycosyltransferase
MNKIPDLSLIVSVYNRSEVVRLVLAAIARQSFGNFEVIIADDGSGPAVKEVVEESRRLYNFPVTHLWQEDAGWRKNRILNSGIRVSRGAYLVFTDGDCLPAKDFLYDHWSERQEGRILLGRRVEMSERWANSLTMEKISSGEFERIGIHELLDGLKGKALRLEDGIRIRSRSLRSISFRKSDNILGSNFSLHKKDIVAINGFDETYEAPGLGEDSDIQYRLSLIGVRGKSLRNLAVQYHVYHPRTKPSENSVRRFEEVRSIGDPICRVGLEHFDKGKPTGSN